MPPHRYLIRLLDLAWRLRVEVEAVERVGLGCRVRYADGATEDYACEAEALAALERRGREVRGED